MLVKNYLLGFPKTFLAVGGRKGTFEGLLRVKNIYWDPLKLFLAVGGREGTFEGLLRIKNIYWEKLYLLPIFEKVFISPIRGFKYLFNEKLFI